jgi:hypothetical protein
MQPIPVKADDLIEALDWIQADIQSDHAAYVERATGEVICFSPELDEDDPEDFENDERFLAVPNRFDLELGARTALDFARSHMPDDAERVASYFRGKGAFRRFKDLLDLRGQTEAWYEFEHHAAKLAFKAWCEAHGFELVG